MASLAYFVLFINDNCIDKQYTASAQGVMRGIVPVLLPKGGSGVDGDAFAHSPAGYENVGDLFDSQHPGIEGHGVINPFTGELLYPEVSFFLQDRYINDLTIFTKSNKINDNPNMYTWGPGNSPNKNEIQNAGAHFSYGDPKLGGLSTDLWCLFAGDRQVTTGSSYIDFEFLQKSLTMTGATTSTNGTITGGSGGFTSLGTQGGRTVGDILLTIEFTNGGGDANAVIRVWTAKAGGGYEYVIHPNSEFLGRIFITNNTSPTHVPFDVYGSDPNGTGIGGDYGVNQWAEGAINLSQVFAAVQDPCFSLSTLFIRTRSSGNSQQSELKDFPGAPIQFKVDSNPKAVAVATNPACNGGFGSINLTVTGGLLPYTYSWTGPNNFTADTEDLTTILAGTYHWEVKNSKGCIATGSVVLVEPPSIVVSSATAVNPKCNAGTDGSISIIATGGTGSLMYSKDNGLTYQASNIFSGLAAGSYLWAVKDVNNCVLKGTVTISQPTDINASAAANNPLCFGVANTGFTITASGGTGSLMYSSDNGATYVASGVFSGLAAGTYSWKVKDANECVKSGTVTISIPADIAAAAAANNPLCFGVANTGFTITASGGTGSLMYSKDNGATYVASGVFSGLAAGTYSWKVKDANECVKSGTVTISIPADIAASATANNPLCFGVANTGFTITASGGTGSLMYSSDNGATYVASGVFSGLAAGTYSWKVKDANECVKSGTVTISIPADIAAAAVANNPLCFGVANTGFTITASGGTGSLMYSKDNGATYVASGVFSGLAAGTYSWKVKDANECVKSGTVTISIPADITASAAANNPLCFGVANTGFTITASGGTGSLMYSKDNGATYVASGVFSGLAAGTYSWKVKDANECVKSGTVTITIPADITASAAANNPLCFGVANTGFTITASGGTGSLMYSKDNGATYVASGVFSGLAAGTYSWKVKDANECVKSGTVTITIPADIAASAVANNPLCFGVANTGFTITASGGTGSLMYSKDNGVTYVASGVFSGLAAGTYSWKVKDANECVKSGTVTISIPAVIVANVTPANPKCCYEPNGSITIAASGGTATLMYSINDGVSYQASNVFSGLLAGEYKWVVKDANNCILKGTVTLTNPPLIAASSTLVNPICHGGTDGSITIIASGGTGTLMYSIDQGNTYHTSNVFTGLAAGEYKWRVKDANDCLLKGTFILTSPPAVIVTSTLVNPKCNGGTDGSITINAAGGNSPLMYSINDGATYQTSQVFNALAAGQYQWVVKEGNGCITRGTVNLIAPTLIVASATPTNPKCNGGTDGSFTITATGGTGTLMYSKDDGSTYQTSNVFAGLTAGEYKWAVKDANDCVKKGIVNLTNPTLISVSVSAVNPSCCEALKDGSITLNASGGAAAFLYSINDGATYQVSNFFGNLSAGEYKWMVKDANNCLTSGTVILRNPSDPLARPAAQTKTASFTAYPVPFKDVLTIRYDFDYTSDVKIEVFNMQGILVLSKTDTNSYLNKEIMLHLHTYKEQEEIFIVKLTTDRGNSVKKVMFSK